MKHQLKLYQEKAIADVIHGFEHGTVKHGTKGMSQGVLLAAEMGLGKTAMAVRVADRMDYSKILVVCSEQTRDSTWVNEINTWKRRERPIYHLTARNCDFYPANFLDQITLGWCIVSYSIIHKWDVRGTKWDLVIVDESIALKSPKSRRATAIIGGEYKGEYVNHIPACKYLFISGAPNPNRIEEIFPTINFLDHDSFPSMESFVEEYFDHIQHGDKLIPVSFDEDTYRVNGTPWNIELLNQTLCDTIMVRILKKDALPDLPNKQYEYVIVPLPESDFPFGGPLERYFGRKLKMRETILHTLNSEKVSKEEKRSLQQSLNELHRHMQEMGGTSSVKVNAVVEYLLKLDEKAVVFGMHIHCIDAICSQLRKAGIKFLKLTGEDTKNTAQIVDKFNNDPSCQFLVSNMTVGGHGLNLQRACALVVFAELDWNADTMLQCEDRVHRVGQEREVKIVHFLLEGSLDGYIFDALDRKNAMHDGVSKKSPVQFQENDGGRAAAGYKGSVGDCVTRAISIALNPDGSRYQEIYDALKSRMRKGDGPRNGCPKEIWFPYLSELGWKRVEIPLVLGRDAAPQLPSGRVIVETIKHLVTAVDGVFHDTSDHSERTKNTVKAYWIKE
jgi:SNF2 family DNA or RNA helicase